MRNTYKYTNMYSGKDPIFEEGDVFRITIPLSEVATATVGPTFPTQDATQVTTQDATQDIVEKLAALINFCSEPRSKKEMMTYLGLVNTNHFRKAYLVPLLKEGKIKMTLPDKPNSRNQKYIRI